MAIGTPIMDMTAKTIMEETKAYLVAVPVSIHVLLAKSKAAKGDAAGVTAAIMVVKKKQANKGAEGKPRALQTAISTGVKMRPEATELQKFVASIAMPQAKITRGI